MYRKFCLPLIFFYSILSRYNILNENSQSSMPLEGRFLYEDLDTFGIGSRGVVMRVDRHFGVPCVGVKQFKIKPGHQCRYEHVKLCVCKTMKRLCLIFNHQMEFMTHVSPAHPRVPLEYGTRLCSRRCRCGSSRFSQRSGMKACGLG